MIWPLTGRTGTLGARSPDQAPGGQHHVVAARAARRWRAPRRERARRGERAPATAALLSQLRAHRASGERRARRRPSAGRRSPRRESQARMRTVGASAGSSSRAGSASSRVHREAELRAGSRSSRSSASASSPSRANDQRPVGAQRDAVRTPERAHSANAGHAAAAARYRASTSAARRCRNRPRRSGASIPAAASRRAAAEQFAFEQRHRIPRCAARQAIEQPITPPPTTITSCRSIVSPCWHTFARCPAANGSPAHGST